MFCHGRGLGLFSLHSLSSVICGPQKGSLSPRLLWHHVNQTEWQRVPFTIIFLKLFYFYWKILRLAVLKTQGWLGWFILFGVFFFRQHSLFL